MTYFVSTVLHALVLFALALIVLDNETIENLFNIVSKPPEQEVQDEDVFQALDQPDQIYNDSFEDNPQDTVATDIIEETTPLQLDINDLEPSIELDDEAFQSLAEIAKQGEFGGRSAKGKQGLIKSQGGNEGSEAAVVRGLKWLADIQLPDGSWSFSEIGASSDPGELKDCQMGATGMALMAFLGAGHTHMKDGPYKNAVRGGLGYLMNNARLTPAGADFRAKSGQGNMYVHGICVIALTEAYGMTKDLPLRNAAEGGIAFIINAQHSGNGGWHYSPNPDKPDTSVVGWQVMALISGHGSKIRIPKNVLTGASNFMNTVELQDDKYVYYGYS
ncbi:MAG TPA: prenyltransferase/squalene oxidase repeat-containing protein, partial [Planctomycetaceae bacterium]|nr:prenyltransferase/squalene oxidase repeat-containing protein [Planctomycetaceae bacterium]